MVRGFNLVIDEMFNFSFVPMMQQSMPFPRIEGANQNNVLSLSDLLT